MSQRETPDRDQAIDEDEAGEPEQDRAPREYGGRKGKDPTRYGDWEKNGRCIDF